MRRRSPFGEVGGSGKGGGIKNPHRHCIPCLAKLGVPARRGPKLFGIQPRTLMMYGFKALDISERARRAVEGRRARRKADVVSDKVVLREQRKAIDRELCQLAQAERAWSNHHPEVKRWAYNKNAKMTYQNSKHSPERTLVRATRTRMWKVARHGKGGQRTIELLGCSPSKFREHLEQRFQPGMSWDNFGQWEIDHIRPCASFDLSDQEQVKACFHYTNTRPMWRSENRSKHSHWQGVHHRHRRSLTCENSHA